MKNVLLIIIGMVIAAACVTTVPGADFNGDSRDDIAIFRPATGLWAVRHVTREYFGGASDTPVVGDYDGDGKADIAVYRPTTGLWAIRSVTRDYFGGSADTPLTGGGGGQRLYDYVVKPGNAADLVRALESDTYRSVFIPSGTYSVSEVITVDNVRKIVGEEQRGTVITFSAGSYLDIFEEYCKVEGIRLVGGGIAGSRGSLYVRSNYVTIENCFSYASDGHGFQYHRHNVLYVLPGSQFRHHSAIPGVDLHLRGNYVGQNPLAVFHHRCGRLIA